MFRLRGSPLFLYLQHKFDYFPKTCHRKRSNINTFIPNKIRILLNYILTKSTNPLTQKLLNLTSFNFNTAN